MSGRRSISLGRGTSTSACCTLLATLPGLPMFGHGQIEGYTERYGMEFKQAGWTSGRMRAWSRGTCMILLRC